MISFEVQWSSLQSLFKATKENGGQGLRAQKIFATTPFKSKGNPLFNIKRTLQKSTMVLLLKKAGAQIPGTPLVARLAHSKLPPELKNETSLFEIQKEMQWF